MKTVRLHRTWYKTDATDEDPEYVGAFSAERAIPDPAIHARTIVSVDWSKRGWVEVTYLMPE